MTEFKKIAYIFASFAEPSNPSELEFLQNLLQKRTSSKGVISNFIDKLLKNDRVRNVNFSSKNSLYDEVEKLVGLIKKYCDVPCLSFHLCHPSTHLDFLEKLEKESADEWYIFPIFPQFSYATSGLIAQFFSKTLDQGLLNKFFWIKSYGSNNSFVSLEQKLILDILKKNNLQERETFLIFAAHGIPNNFLKNGDFYESECQTSAKTILKAFPYALGKLGFYNFYFENDNNTLLDICKNIKTFAKDRKNALFVPISSCLEFSKTTSEIEDNLCKVLKSQGINSFKVPSLGLNLDWVRSILNIIEEKNCVSNHMLTNAPAGLLNVN